MNRKLTHIAIMSIALTVSSNSYAFLDGFFSKDKSKNTDSNQPQQIQNDANSFSEGKNKQLAPFFRNLWIEGERNAVLNFNYLGLAAIEIGDYNLAKAALDESVDRIEAIYAGDKNAEKAKSLWNEEKVKDFKGEPYERSMAYYYRGLLYLKDGDYQNARAAFLSAERHDSLSELDKFQSDFGLMNFLAAWSSYCDGDRSRGKELFARAQTQDSKNFESISFERPFIVLTETGLGPEKIGTGKFQEVLQLVPSKESDDFKNTIFPKAGLRTVSESPKLVGDVTFQGMTRGGRPIQGILNGKANFKDNIDTAGNVAVEVGTTTMLASAGSGDSNTAAAGAVITAFGALGKIFGSAITPKADTRVWSSLPDKIYLQQSAAFPKSGNLDLSYQNENKQSKSFAAKMNGKSGMCGFAWARTKSALTADNNGFARISSTPEIEETNRVERNQVFRSMLTERFKTTN